MKLVFVALIISAIATKSVVDHYHYHFEKFSPKVQRLLMKELTSNPRHLDVFTQIKCITDHLENASARRQCLDQAKNASNDAQDDSNNTDDNADADGTANQSEEQQPETEESHLVVYGVPQHATGLGGINIQVPL